MQRFILLLSVLFILGSCGDGYIVKEHSTIDKGGWAYQDTFDFALNVQDTTKLYSLFMDIDHTTDYAFQNLYINIYTKFPSGQRLKKQLPIDLADARGAWHGTCSGKNCSLPVVIQENAYFNEIGEYQFTIEQFTRQDSLSDLKGITFKVKDTGLTK